MQLATNSKEVINAINLLQAELDNSPQLASRLGQAHAFYIDDSGVDGPLFGFSKFVGYVGLNADTYLEGAKYRSGTNTEHALSAFFEEIDPGSKLYKSYYHKLAAWLAKYGKSPRKGVRLMVLKSEHRDKQACDDEDRRLLDLLISVSDLLPTQQRQELRGRL
jgi:hypothetical protein